MSRTTALSTTLRNPVQGRAWILEALKIVAAWMAAGEEVWVEFVIRKSREQERLYHSIFRDFAKQLTHCGREMDEEEWKRLMIDAFYRATKDDPELAGEWKGREPRQIPNLDGDGWVEVGIESKKFTKALATAFITYMHAWGDSKEVRWSDTSLGRETVALLRLRDQERSAC